MVHKVLYGKVGDKYVLHMPSSRHTQHRNSNHHISCLHNVFVTTIFHRNSQFEDLMPDIWDAVQGDKAPGTHGDNLGTLRHKSAHNYAEETRVTDLDSQLSRTSSDTVVVYPRVMSDIPDIATADSRMAGMGCFQLLSS
jgi:hypothetical protein